MRSIYVIEEKYYPYKCNSRVRNSYIEALLIATKDIEIFAYFKAKYYYSSYRSTYKELFITASSVVAYMTVL